MNTDAASVVLAVRDTLDRVSRGESPYGSGPVPEHTMHQAGSVFSDSFDVGALYSDIERMFMKGESPERYLRDFASVVFAQGFSAGSKYERGKRMQE